MIRCLVLFAILVVCIPLSLWAQDPEKIDISTAGKVGTVEEEILSPEELFLFSEEELVTVATKRAVAVREAPANVTVITHDEIMRSPGLGIPEILRRVAGMDVVTVTASESDISPRGFATTIVDGDRIAVLIDGRTVHFEPLGGTIFSALPISKYDIKRIEVIKGPMSSLHGSRALLGVINIVTYNPEETRTVLAGGGGMYKAARADFINAGKFTKGLWYKVTGTYKRDDELENVSGSGRQKDREMLAATAMLDWKPTDKIHARLSGGFNIADLILSLAGLSKWNARDGFVMADFSYDFDTGGIFTAKSWWRRIRLSSPDFFGLGFPATNFDSVTAELRHTWEYVASDRLKNIATIGLEYNLLASQKTGYFSNAEDLHNFAGFLQNELRLWDKLLFTVGFRSDYQKGFTKLNNSAHGSLVLLLHPKYSIRASVSSAFNTPSYSNFFSDIQGITDFLPGIDADLVGNRNLSSERIFYVELGNTVTPKPWLKISADLFYYRLTSMLASQVNFTSPTTAEINPVNQGGTNAFGGEVGVEAEVYKGINVYTNWAYEHMSSFDNSIIQAKNQGNPRNKVNAGVRYKSDFGFLASMDFHWVQGHQAQAGVLPNTSTAAVANINDIYLIDMKLAYQPIKDHLEISVIANNILNDETAQVPPIDPLLNKRLSQRPHFRLLGNLSYTF